MLITTYNTHVCQFKKYIFRSVMVTIMILSYDTIPLSFAIGYTPFKFTIIFSMCPPPNIKIMHMLIKQ